MKRQIIKTMLSFTVFFLGPVLSTVYGADPREGMLSWPLQWETLGRGISAYQNQSGVFRDQSVYRQTLSLIQLDKPGGSGREDSLNTRRYTLLTGPNNRREIAVVTELAKDGENQPLAGEWSTPGILGLAQFWEELFFPFFPEKIKRYEILEVENAEEGDVRAKSVHFTTREGLKGVPFVNGYAYVSSKGEMLRLVWKEIRQLESIDPRFTGWTISNVSITFYSPEEGIQIPQSANLEFTARNKPWKGSYRLRYQEIDHRSGELPATR